MLRVKELLNNLLKQTKNPDLARKFVDLVIGEAGQKVLNQAGSPNPELH
jgi:molybdate transport system substrate-binding protein